MRLTDFFIGVVVGIGAALLYRRCPPTSAAARPDVDGKRTIPFNQDRQYGRTGTEG